MLFESLDRDEAALAEKKSGARAIIAAGQKAAHSLLPYLSTAINDPAEYSARLEYVTGAVESFTREACTEYDADYDTVFPAVMAQLRYSCKDCGCDCSKGDCSCDNCSTCKESSSKWSGAHADGCGCGFCKNMRKNQGNEDPEEEPENITSEARVAVEVETGDTYVQERVTLPKGNEDAHSQVGSPKIDKGRVPKDGLKPVDVPSKQYPSEMQDVEQQPDYDTQTNQGANTTPDSTKNPRERVDAGTPMQPAETHGPHTKTFPNKNQADPVTSKWTVEGGFAEAD